MKVYVIMERYRDWDSGWDNVCVASLQQKIKQTHT